MGTSDAPSRKRGLLWAVLGLLFLLAGAILGTGMRPEVGGHYELLPKLLIYPLSVLGPLLLVSGFYRLLVGPGTGSLAGTLKILAVLGSVVGLAVGSLWFYGTHLLLSRPFSESSSSDWDWD